MKQLWWKCPKCGNKINFSEVTQTLFDYHNGEAYFESESGVPFYILKCYNVDCKATWNIGISPMYEE
jgi:hypothetical protein